MKRPTANGGQLDLGLTLLHLFTKSKIGNFNIPLVTKKNIGRLEVIMDDFWVSSIKIVQDIEKFLDYFSSLFLFEGSLVL